jgi:hypothetical protein
MSNYHYDPEYLLKYTNTYADQANKDLTDDKKKYYDLSVLKPYMCSKYSNAAGFISPERFCTNIKKYAPNSLGNDPKPIGPEIKTTAKIDLSFDPDKKNPYNLVNKMAKELPEYLWLHDPGTQVKATDYSYVFDEQIDAIKKMLNGN